MLQLFCNFLYLIKINIDSTNNLTFKYMGEMDTFGQLRGRIPA